jgi:hypothetical protein
MYTATSLATGMHPLYSPHAGQTEDDQRIIQPTRRAITVVEHCPDPIKTLPTCTRPPI